MYRMKNGKKAWQHNTFRLLRNPICVVPILLFIFILSFYFTLQAALHENYFPPGSFRFESHEKDKFYPIEFHGEKIVHLDFKGAPLKLNYLKHIFPIIAKLGATALLIEYEDMFPFQKDEAFLRSDIAYTIEEVKAINDLAYASGLKIIPFIQTFSHLEYILKHSVLKELREEPLYPTDICPSHTKTNYILSNITEQILRMHPKTSMVHIGGNEVAHIGRCRMCRAKVNKGNNAIQHLYLNHIKNVAVLIKRKHPNITVLVWDDFLRRIASEDMIKMKLRDYVQPVVWHYDENILYHITDEILQKYRMVFGSVWFASAFKGTSGPDSYLTKTTFYLHNMQTWLNIYRQYKNVIDIRGMILIGPQRYDHFAVLCELLPVSIASLGLTLSLLHGKDVPSYSIPKHLNEILMCQEPLAVTFFGNGQAFCSYPGGALFDGMVLYHEHKLEYDTLKKSKTIRGWMNNYNVRKGVYNIRELEAILPEILTFRRKFETLGNHLKMELSEFYREATVNEWFETYMQATYEDISILIGNAEKLLRVTAWDQKD